MASTQVPKRVITIDTNSSQWILSSVGSMIDNSSITSTSSLPDTQISGNLEKTITFHTINREAVKRTTSHGQKPCNEPIASLSMKELRMKGSAFLRSHASKHGITNASRKLTVQVTAELAQHYEKVHNVTVLYDDGHHKENGIVQSSQRHHKRTSSAGSPFTVSRVSQLTLQPIPISALVQPIASRDVPRPIINKSDLQITPLKVDFAPVQFQTNAGVPDGICNAEILVKTRVELAACGTSMLRPEAAAHKVHNSSRKPKDIVVEELWNHYLVFHSKEIVESDKNACLGEVVDDDEKGDQT